jgi:hypothetical protein
MTTSAIANDSFDNPIFEPIGRHQSLERRTSSVTHDRRHVLPTSLELQTDNRILTQLGCESTYHLPTLAIRNENPSLSCASNILLRLAADTVTLSILDGAKYQNTYINLEWEKTSRAPRNNTFPRLRGP